jgi:hypothetical protein
MKKQSKSKTGKAKQTKANQQRSQPPSQIQAPKHRRLWLASKLVVGTVVTVLGLVATFVSLWGPLWPTAPLFSPGMPSSGSPFDVPFTVTNRSVIFFIRNLIIHCALNYIERNGTKVENIGISMDG